MNEIQYIKFTLGHTFDLLHSRLKNFIYNSFHVIGVNFYSLSFLVPGVRLAALFAKQSKTRRLFVAQVGLLAKYATNVPAAAPACTRTTRLICKWLSLLYEMSRQYKNERSCIRKILSNNGERCDNKKKNKMKKKKTYKDGYALYA